MDRRDGSSACVRTYTPTNNTSGRDVPLNLGKVDLKSGRAVTPGHVASVGVPGRAQMLHSGEASQNQTHELGLAKLKFFFLLSLHFSLLRSFINTHTHTVRDMHPPDLPVILKVLKI